MRKFPACAAALVVAAAPLAVQAGGIQYVDLRGLDLTKPSDLRTAEFRVQTAAQAHCGPAHIPQPIELTAEASVCQSRFIARGQAAVRAARDAQVAGRKAPTVLALR